MSISSGIGISPIFTIIEQTGAELIGINMFFLNGDRFHFLNGDGLEFLEQV